MSQYWFLSYISLRWPNIFCDTSSNNSVNWQVWFLNLLSIAVLSKEQFVDTAYGRCMPRMFPNSRHEPHKLTFSHETWTVTNQKFYFMAFGSTVSDQWNLKKNSTCNLSGTCSFCSVIILAPNCHNFPVSDRFQCAESNGAKGGNRQICYLFGSCMVRLSANMKQNRVERWLASAYEWCRKTRSTVKPASEELSVEKYT